MISQTWCLQFYNPLEKHLWLQKLWILCLLALNTEAAGEIPGCLIIESFLTNYLLLFNHINATIVILFNPLKIISFIPIYNKHSLHLKTYNTVFQVKSSKILQKNNFHCFFRTMTMQIKAIQSYFFIKSSFEFVFNHKSSKTFHCLQNINTAISTKPFDLENFQESLQSFPIRKSKETIVSF